MNVLLATFQAVSALLGIGVIGFWVIGHRRVPAVTLGFLSSLAINIALPFLVLSNLLRGFSPQEFPGWWKMPLWWLGFTAISLILSLATSYIARKDIRGEFAISLFYQNGLFFPLIILTGLFGLENPYLISLFLFMALHPSLVFSTYTLFFPTKIQAQKLNWGRIISPVTVATIMGMVIGLAAIKSYVPDFIFSVLTMVGAMATPLFMLILGGNIYNDFINQGKGKKRFDTGEVLKFVAIKNLVFPLVFIGLLIWLRPDTDIALIILLQAAVPPITAIPIFCDRCGGNRAIAGQFIVASFVFSLISIPVMVYLFRMFFSIPLE